MKKSDSKRVRLESTGIMGALSQSACSEGISIVQYVSLILYFFAIATPGYHNIFLIAKRISEGDSLDNLNSNNLVSPEKSTFLAHTSQFIELNDNRGLKKLSEEGLEQAHKLIRRFSEYLSRKSDFF